MGMSREATYPVRTTERSLALLEELRDRNGARIADLAADLEMAKSTIHNHLSTLVEHGYVVKAGDRYQLGLRSLELGGAARAHLRLYSVAVASVHEASGRLAVGVHAEEADRDVLVHLSRPTAEGGGFLLGRRVPLHAAPSGRAMLALLPDERVDEAVAAVEDGAGPDSLTGEALGRRLERVRNRGFATRLDDADHPQRVAVPVRGENGAPLGAVSYVERDDEAVVGEAESVDHLRRIVDRIERQVSNAWYSTDTFVSPKHSWYVFSGDESGPESDG